MREYKDHKWDFGLLLWTGDDSMLPTGPLDWDLDLELRLVNNI